MKANLPTSPWIPVRQLLARMEKDRAFRFLDNNPRASIEMFLTFLAEHDGKIGKNEDDEVFIRLDL